MNRLICQKPVLFLSAPMALISNFFEMFTVLGMYNFENPQPPSHDNDNIDPQQTIKNAKYHPHQIFKEPFSIKKIANSLS